MKISKINLNIIFTFLYVVGFVLLAGVIPPYLINMRDDFFSIVGLLMYPLSLMWFVTGGWLLIKFNMKKENNTNEDA